MFLDPTFDPYSDVDVSLSGNSTGRVPDLHDFVRGEGFMDVDVDRLFDGWEHLGSDLNDMAGAAEADSGTESGNGQASSSSGGLSDNLEEGDRGFGSDDKGQSVGGAAGQVNSAQACSFPIDICS